MGAKSLRRGALLDKCATRREVAAQHGKAALFGQRTVEWTNDVLFPLWRVVEHVLQRPAGHRHRVHVQQRGKLAQDRGEPARFMQLLHVMVT